MGLLFHWRPSAELTLLSFLLLFSVTVPLSTTAWILPFPTPKSRLLHNIHHNHNHDMPHSKLAQRSAIRLRHRAEDDHDHASSSSSRMNTSHNNQRVHYNYHGCDRRHFLAGAITITATSLLPEPTTARGLVKFPVNDPKQLLNTYHFLRVGDTLLEDDDIWSTNPLFLTNREAALSPLGMDQIQEACAQMMALPERSPTVVKYSLAASCIDTANIVGDTLDLGRDRLVPEFTFLDPRGIGKWEMLSYSQTKPAVWALDALEAGPNGTGGRPPANQDGTPNETLADQAVRLRQVMSVLETLYSGETILLVFPDGTGPALLSAMIAGIPLNRVHELEYGPGELRMDVTKASTLKILKEREATQKEMYDETIATGLKELERLRSTKNDDIVSLKDQKIEAERIEIDNQYNEKEAQRLKVEGEERESRMARQRQASADSMMSDGGAGFPFAALGAASVIGTAGVFAASGNDTNEKKTTTSAESDPGTGQGLQLENFGDDTTQVQPMLSDIVSEPTIPTKPVDPFGAADKAMQEYLDRDDGAEDWLSVMSDIIEEGDDADDQLDQADGSSIGKNQTRSFE